MNSFAFSGSAIRVDATNEGPGRAVQVLNWNSNAPGCLSPGQPNPRHGMCSLHLDEWDDGPAEPFHEFPIPNQYLMADVTYATEGRGGEFSVGLTRGTILAVGGVDVISVKAYFVSGVADAALVVSQAKRVQATVTWPTSINPKEATLALPSIALVGGAASGFVKIPRQTSSMVVYVSDSSRLATLRLDFATTPNAATIFISQLNPNANGMNVERGAEFVRFQNPDDVVVTPTFALWP